MSQQNLDIKYHKLRMFGSDVHAYSFIPNANLTIALCKGAKQREEPSKTGHKWFETNGFTKVFGTNASFFNTTTLDDSVIQFEYVDSGTQTSPITNAAAWIEMLFLKDGRLHFEELTQAKFDTTYKADTRFGLSVSWELLRDGAINLNGIEDHPGLGTSKAPRTIIGTDAKTGTIFGVTIDGRNMPSKIDPTKKSLGATAFECAMVLKFLGCTDGGSLDGGGSTTMVGPNSVVLNNPSDGKERKVANVINLYARGKATIKEVNSFTPTKLFKGVVFGLKPGETLNVRASHSSAAASVGIMSNGEAVDVYASTAGWYLVDPVNSKWVSATYVRKEEAAQPTPIQTFAIWMDAYVKGHTNITEADAKVILEKAKQLGL